MDFLQCSMYNKHLFISIHHQRAQMYFDLMCEIARDGGSLAMSYFNRCTPGIKRDGSIVTDADIAVSELISEKLSGLLLQRNHVLLDEERCDRVSFNDALTSEYVWVVDPIDGTLPFSYGMPNFGISIGLLKDRKPYLGVVYFPALDEMYSFDGNIAEHVKKPFSEKSERHTISSENAAPDVDLGAPICAFFSPGLKSNFKKGQGMAFGCASLSLCYAATGRAGGVVMRAKLWDIAGAWPVLLSAGLDIRTLSLGCSVDEISPVFFDDRDDGENASMWKLRDYSIVGTRNNYEKIKKSIDILI